VSTLLLSAVHPVTPYTHTQPSIAIRELCGTLSSVCRLRAHTLLTFTCNATLNTAT
jgi:hypothetical protein